jgi:histone acetyltransferase (RNA polymerase elongator complex component)|tara:strand:- start:859 stop:1875 length:1017 start_codon:yes stop_codon:yes gene_type:complete
MPRERLIIPIFIPHQGCPYRCAFCDQKNISGVSNKADKEMIESTLNQYLGEVDSGSLPLKREVAFYGGSFTGLPMERQRSLFSIVQPWLEDGTIQSIRVSTHPLFINEDVLTSLLKFGVKTVELGIQSTDQNVLELSGRKCTWSAMDTAVKKIRDFGFNLGLQMMSGLPGDSEETFYQTVEDVLNWNPDFVRIYPTLVIKNTEIHEMFLRKEFVPWSLDRTVGTLKNVVLKFRQRNIPIVRLGLHAEPSMLENFVAGPYHPSIRYLIDCEIGFDELSSIVKRLPESNKKICFQVPSKKLSLYKGHKLENVRKLKELFNLDEIAFEPSENLDYPKAVAA